MTLCKLQEVFECHTQIELLSLSEYHAGINPNRLFYVDYIPFEYEDVEIEIIKVVYANRLLVLTHQNL